MLSMISLPLLAAPSSPAGTGDLVVRAAVDLVCLAVLTLGLFLPRHHRRDLVTVFWLFNVAMFAVLLVVSTGQIGVGAGLGLFGVLSIVRLRSEQYRNVEIGYFFVSLALALVNGLGPGVALPVTLSAAVLLVVLLIDSDRLLPVARHVEVVLDRVVRDEDELRAELAERLGGDVVEIGITQVDYVRLTMVIDVQFRPYRSAVRQGAAGPR